VLFVDLFDFHALHNLHVPLTPSQRAPYLNTLPPPNHSAPNGTERRYRPRSRRGQRRTRQAVYNAIERGQLNTTKLGRTLTVVFRDEALAAYEVPNRTDGRAPK